MNAFSIFRGLGSMIAGALAFLFGSANPLFYALISFMVIDYITGVMCAISKHELSSETGARGILKKFAIILIVAISHIIDTVIIKEGSTMQAMVSFFYLANEGLSILENVVFLGLPVPAMLRKLLLQIKEKSDDEGTSAE